MPQLEPVVPSVPPVATFQIVEVASVSAPDPEMLAPIDTDATLAGVTDPLEASSATDVAPHEAASPRAAEAEAFDADHGTPVVDEDAPAQDQPAHGDSGALSVVTVASLSDVREAPTPTRNLEPSALDLEADAVETTAAANAPEQGDSEQAGSEQLKPEDTHAEAPNAEENRSTDVPSADMDSQQSDSADFEPGTADTTDDVSAAHAASDTPDEPDGADSESAAALLTDPQAPRVEGATDTHLPTETEADAPDATEPSDRAPEPKESDASNTGVDEHSDATVVPETEVRTSMPRTDPGEEAHIDPDADVGPEALKKMFAGPVLAREPGGEADERDLLAGVAEMAVDPEDAARVRQQTSAAEYGDAEPRIPTVLQADYARLHARKPSVFVRTLVIVASALALLALPLQYAWFEPQDLVARYPQARPYVTAFCNHAKCAQLLPEDRGSIEILSRDVRIHPRFEGALQIHATIVNRGNYAQTYPQVRFTLFNDNGNVIASRLFTPAEYLRRTDVSLLRLQAGETSQIQLDLIAPEDTAVSFEFEFI